MLIYKVTFPNNKCYIGQTVKSLNARKSLHFNQTKNGSKNAFHNALRKYNNLNIIWEILEVCVSKEQLNIRETYWINHFNSTAPNGYNLTFGGDSRLHTQESKNKLSASKKGKQPHSDEFYKNLGIKQTGKNNPFYGKTHNEETKNKISQSNLGRKHSLEHKKKISKIVLVFKKDTNEFVGEFSSATECSKILNLNIGHICSIARGNTNLKNHKGYFFKYKEVT